MDSKHSVNIGSFLGAKNVFITIYINGTLEDAYLQTINQEIRDEIGQS